MISPRIILVTEPTFDDGHIVRCVQLVGRALPAGWLAVQLRDKRRPRARVQALALELRDVTRDCGAALVINGDARVARDVGADGVHLGRDAGTAGEARAICGAHAWISAAAHSDAAARLGAQAGVDAILVSPVFPTQSPSDVTPKAPRGLEAVRSARAAVGTGVRLYALGGVGAHNVRPCLDAGADGVAALSALLASDEPACVARAMHDAFAAHC